jgi:NAD-dependent DNA ligase
VGLRTIRAITNAKISDFVKIKGIGKKTAETIFNGIHSTMRKTRLDRYIPASTTLNLGIGRKLIKQLLTYHPTLMEDSEDVLRIILPKKNIPGIGAKRIANIVENIAAFKKFLYDLAPDDIDFAIKRDAQRAALIAARGYNKKIRGKVFVMTGFFGKIDYELEDYVYDHFGSFATTVDASTTAVISANLMEVTTKMLTAERLGIKVYSIEEFVKEYEVPYSKENTEGEAGPVMDETEVRDDDD